MRARVPDGSKHFPALDGVRGLAVLAVIIVHAQIAWAYEGPGHWVGTVAGLGQHGVDLFFVLSGFLITGILDDSRNSLHYFRNFYARRAVRIFPLYYLFLVIAFFVQPLIVHKPDVALHYRWWFWLYCSNFLIARIGMLPWSPVNVDITWSLAIEEQFYVVWPMIVLLFRGTTLRKICLWTVCGSTLFRLCAELMQVDRISIYVLTPSRLDALAFGGWAALSLRDAKCWNGFFIRRRVAIGISAIGTATACFIAATRFPAVEVIQATAYVVGFVGYSAGFAALLLHLCLSTPHAMSVQVFSLRPLRLYGKLSYFLYLFHWPILRALSLAIRPGDAQTVGRFGAFSGLIFLVAALTVPLAPAWFSWHVFESQCLKVKRFFPAHQGALRTNQRA